MLANEQRLCCLFIWIIRLIYNDWLVCLAMSGPAIVCPSLSCPAILVNPLDRLFAVCDPVTFDLILIGRRELMMDYPCAKFGDFSFSRFARPSSVLPGGRLSTGD